MFEKKNKHMDRINQNYIDHLYKMGHDDIYQVEKNIGY